MYFVPKMTLNDCSWSFHAGTRRLFFGGIIFFIRNTTKNNDYCTMGNAFPCEGGARTNNNELDDEPEEEEKEEFQVVQSTSRVQRLSSAKSEGMESSVVKFKNVNFVVGSKEKQKNILTDVSGVVTSGRVLASKFLHYSHIMSGWPGHWSV